MTNEEIAWGKINKGNGLIDSGLKILRNIWCKKNKIPKEYINEFSLVQETGGEIALHLGQSDLTGIWDMGTSAKSILDSAVNGLDHLDENSEEYKLAKEILNKLNK